MAAAAGSARGALAALEASLELQEEEGEVPARLLVEHLMEGRRRQKLLLAQLRVLRSLLGVLETPGPAPVEPTPSLRASARSCWQGLKASYWSELGELGGALGQLKGARRRLGGLQQKLELLLKLQEALTRRKKLLQERRRHEGALQGLRVGVARACAGCRLYQMLRGEAEGIPQHLPVLSVTACEPPQ